MKADPAQRPVPPMSSDLHTGLGPAALTKARQQLASVIQSTAPPPTAPAPPGSLTHAELALEEAAEHLESAADHLESVADQLTHHLAPPAITPTALPAAPAIPGAPAIPAAATAPSLSAQLAIPSTLFVIVALLLVLFESLQTQNKTLTWITLLTMNVVGTVGFNVMLRRSAWQKVDQWVTATVLQTGLFLPFLLKEIISPIHFPVFTPFDLFLIALAVTCLITLQFCNVKALQHLETSVFAVIFNSRIILATIFGTILLSELVSPWALVGGGLIFAAIFIVRQKGTKAITAQGIMYGLGAALAMSLMNTCEKELIKQVGYQQYIFPMWGAAAIIMWAVIFARRIQAPYRLLIRPQGLVIMTLRAYAGIGFTAALIYGSVAVSSYVSSLSVVLTIIIGMLFLGERDYLKYKLAAAGVALAGLSFILIDRL
jgi:drug/metabolite transporter (DMT)-like permease